MRKRQKLGQHLLTEPTILDRIVKASEIKLEEVVFEIGTGGGHLTEKICKSGSRVISVELDQKFFKIAKERLGYLKNLELIHGDGFKLDCKFDVLISNIPYSKSLRLIEWLSNRQLKRGIVTVQKEFADKILAKPGLPNYRAVSVLAQNRFTIQKLFDIEKDYFNPPPLVNSAVILLKTKGADPIHPQIVSSLKTLFSFRGRLVSPSIKSILKYNEKELNMLIDVLGYTLLQKRIERLNVEEAFGLAKMLAEINYGK